MMLNLINIKLETEITLFLNNLCNMLSGRDILGQVLQKPPSLYKHVMLVLALLKYYQISTHPGTRTYTPEAYSFLKRVLRLKVLV